MPRKATLRLKTRACLLAARSISEQSSSDAAAPRTTAQLAASLKDDLRLLYEQSSLTVREIARAAGLSERRLYKLAEEGGWRDRRAADRGKSRRGDAVLSKADDARLIKRTRVTLRRSRDAAQQEAMQADHLRALRRVRAADRRFERAMRVYEKLAAALAELARFVMRDDAHARALAVVPALQELLLRQMREAFVRAV
jgi:DNA-binding Lrp family transcriptional regulator